MDAVTIVCLVIMVVCLIRLFMVEPVFIIYADRKDEDRYAMAYEYPFRSKIRKLWPSAWREKSKYFKDFDILNHGLTSNENVVWTPLNIGFPIYWKRPFEEDKVCLFYVNSINGDRVDFGKYQVFEDGETEFIVCAPGKVYLDKNTLTTPYDGTLVLNYEYID